MRTHSVTTHFTTLRLRPDDVASWAVVGQPSGAIAIGVDGRLLMRLTRSAAEAIAADLTVHAGVHGPQECPAARVTATAARPRQADDGAGETIRPPGG